MMIMTVQSEYFVIVLIDSTAELHSLFFIHRETLADSQEYLCIQYAGLAQYTYNRISNSLGGAFDTSASTQEMRRNMWLAPVLARLQRRCVRFSSSAAEERIEELFAATFTKMLDKLKFDVSPRYTLAGTEEKSETAPTSTATDTATALVTADRHKSLPAWDLAHFVQKVLRNSVQVTADLAGLESRVCGVLRERLSARIRSLHRPMERIIEEENRSFLSEKKIKIVEDLLNVGHECLAAVWVLWQIRHNIVGVPNAEGAFVKDFLRPVSLYSLVDGTPLKSAMVMESVPKDLRADVLEALQSAVKAQLQPPDDDHDEEKKQEESGLLESVALLGAAVRHTAGEEFRALSTYNMDSDELPFSRDAIFITALSALLSSVLTAPTLHVELLYENLLAFVVLEETLGVREPRAAASKAFEVALKTSSTALLEHPGMVADATSQRELRHRVDAVERALGMLLRLPEGAGAECRMRAFQTAIDEMVSAGEHRGGRGLRDVQAVYPSMANILGLPASAAEEYVKPLGQTRFDKTVGEMLLNSDVAVSMPELGATFEEQVRSMAEALLISPQDAEDRTVILAGAVLSSLLQNALDQSRKMSTARVDSLIQKAYYMYKHPLLRRLQDKRGSGAGAGADIKEVGMQMAIARVGAGSVVDLMRVLEAARSRMAVMAQHGGTGGSKDDFGSTGNVFFYFIGLLCLLLLSLTLL